MWNILGDYSERMQQWTSVFRKWKKGLGDYKNTEDFKNGMDGLSDNKDFNNSLLKKVNAMFNKIYTCFPALDWITLDDDAFNV